MHEELTCFNHSDASQAISLFEKARGEKLLRSLRRQLIENSQGYPWLLKKLSIHLYNQFQAGASQPELMDKALDIESLFKKDLQTLSSSERTCLRLIAENAPADWFDVLDTSGQEIVNQLLDKRLVIRSGDRLILYWDIFKEYVLSKKIPSIPLTYLPGYTSLKTTLLVAEQLKHKSPISYSELSTLANINEKTVDNIIRDLIMFGIASGGQSQAQLNESMKNANPDDVLNKLRHELRNHAITIDLLKYDRGSIVTDEDVIMLMKKINPVAQHQDRTWKVYKNRIMQLLVATGYVTEVKDVWRIEDQGNISYDSVDIHKASYKENRLFIGETSPQKTYEALKWIIDNQNKTWGEIIAEGYRNAIATLVCFRIVENTNRTYKVRDKYSGQRPLSILWDSVKEESILKKISIFLKQNPFENGYAVGEFCNKIFKKDWSEATKKRNGNSLRQWTLWLMKGEGKSEIPNPLGRAKKNKKEIVQPSLF